MEELINAPLTFIIMILTGLASYKAFEDRVLWEKMLFRPYAINQKKEYYRFISAGFIHADWQHLIFNMISLYFFAPAIEQYLTILYGFVPGKLLFLALYFGGKIFASLPVYAKHKDDAYYSALGASGAVSAVIFAAILLAPTMKLMIFPIPVPIPAFIFGALYLAYSSYMSKQGRDNVGHDAHFYGGLFGLLFFIVLDYDNLGRFFEQIQNWLQTF